MSCAFVLCAADLPDLPTALVPSHDLVCDDGVAITCPGSLMPDPPTHDAILLLGQQAATILRRHPTPVAPKTRGSDTPPGYPLGRAAAAGRESYFPPRPADAS